jgi:hypothetical protein
LLPPLVAPPEEEEEEECVAGCAPEAGVEVRELNSPDPALEAAFALG